MPGELARPDWDRLADVLARFRHESEHVLGYPCSTLFDYSALAGFLAFAGNNIGDPYLPSNYHLNTHDLERDVVEVFATLTHAPANAHWGYVTTGGTEGNMYGLFLARELYPDGIVYYSEDTHYSVHKILRNLHIRNIMIRSRPDGSMDLDDLNETVKIHRDVPPLLFVNVGTTMKGAVDDLDGIHVILRRFGLREYYLHADAALSGMVLPFVENPPAWDFRAPIDSISISGHKMIGCPFPCGVVLARQENVERITRKVEYIGTLDTTLAGSRNALAPLFLWYALKTVGLDGFRERVRECLAVADYAVEQLCHVGRRAWRHRHANTVVFDRPADSFVTRWQLAVEGEIAHLIAMPQVTRSRIDRFVADLKTGAKGPP